MRRQAQFRSLFLSVVLLCVAAGPARAVDEIRLSLGDLSGTGWWLRKVELLVQLPDATGRIELHAAQAQLPGETGRLSELRIDCPELAIEAESIDCPAGEFSVRSEKLGQLRGRLKLRYSAAAQQLELRLHQLALAGGMLELQGGWSENSGWHFNAHGQGLAMEQLLVLAQQLGHDTGLGGKGRVDIQAQGSGRAAQLQVLRLTAALDQLAFNDAAGLHAAEALVATVRAELRPRGRDWDLNGRVQVEAGQVYLDPVYVEARAAPGGGGPPVLQLDWQGRWQVHSRQLMLEQLTYQHAGVLSLSAQSRLNFDPAQSLLQQLSAQVDEAIFPAVYDTYLKPWLLDTSAGDLDTAGRLSGSLRLSEDGLQSLQLSLDELSLDDRQQRYALYDLSGKLDWAQDTQARRSQLAWRGGSLYRMELGAAALELGSTGMAFELLAPARIPVLDGALLIDSMSLNQAATPDMAWTFDGVLTPISMQSFTAAMGWPSLSGKLSGMIPEVRYEQGLLSMGGVLLVRAFDGEITVRDLRMERPFSIVPRLRADVEINDLDLETLTRTFSFGRIEGRIGGYIRGLRMEQWRPVAFDARLATPEGDRSRHRISQRALDNLSSIGGGGVGGALSRSFLGFFEAFPYARLGIGCRLQQGICEMSGAGPANTGYYIVQGSLLPPRVNVIGYADQVDWPTLIGQLQEATRLQSPSVQ